MAKSWAKRLEGIQKLAVKNKKGVSDRLKKLDKQLKAAKHFINVHGQMTGRIKTYDKNLVDILEQAGRIAAEASVYEDELAVAKKAKDKKKIKELEKKLQAMDKDYEESKSNYGTEVTYYKEDVAAVEEAAAKVVASE